jgi:hypothetical protein
MLIGCISLIIYNTFTSNSDEKYDGDYPELYSVAINSVLGAKGYWSEGHGPWSSKVRFIQKDSLNRVMFLYFPRPLVKTMRFQRKIYNF